MFAEWSKFMFLNKMHIEECDKSHIRVSRNYKRKDSTNRAYRGLQAPPHLDLIWKYMVTTEAYEDFCTQIFGGFLDRTASIEASPEDIKPMLYYSRTYKLYTKYFDTMNAFGNLWPVDQFDENFKVEKEDLVYIPNKDLKKYLQDLEDTFDLAPHRSTMEDWKSICSEFRESKWRKMIHKRVEVAKFDDIQVRYDGSEVSLQTCFKDIQSKFNLDETLITKVKRQYLVAADTAQAWIFEYVKFICMMIGHQKDIFPPKCVENVWNLHAGEFTFHYRDMSFIVFESYVLPDSYSEHFKEKGESVEKYGNALKIYEE